MFRPPAVRDLIIAVGAGVENKVQNNLNVQYYLFRRDSVDRNYSSYKNTAYFKRYKKCISMSLYYRIVVDWRRSGTKRSAGTQGPY